jgi:hypothetical protein
MSLEEFMEQNIDDFLESIAEAKETFDSTPGFSLSKDDAAKIAQNLAKVVEFENQVSDYATLKKIIRDMEAHQATVDYDIDNEDDRETFEVPKKLKTKMEAVKKILNDKPLESLSDKDKETIDKFADELSMVFRQFKFAVKSDYKETGGEVNRITWKQSFPVRLDVGEASYYGLVRPPTGIITWQGPTARGAARKAGVPVKMPIMNVGDKKNPNFKVKRGADAYGEFMSKFQSDESIDFDFDDSDIAKEKVNTALQDAGATINSPKDDYMKGIQQAILDIKLDDMIEESLKDDEKKLLVNESLTKNVSFWQNITKIL